MIEIKLKYIIKLVIKGCNSNKNRDFKNPNTKNELNTQNAINEIYYKLIKLSLDRLSILRKIAIVGTTGSGKTSFLSNLIKSSSGRFTAKGDVNRNVEIEEEEVQTFTSVKPGLYNNSTTTVSLNAQSFIFLVTVNNEFKSYVTKGMRIPIPLDLIDTVFPIVFIDLPGQERFAFMQDNGMKGTDGAIIFADGTNVSSLERVSYYLNLIKREEKKYNRHIPVVIFVNKLDLSEKGIYVGASVLNHWIEDKNIMIFETTNLDLDTFMKPLRYFLHRLPGMPINPKKIIVS